MNIDSRNTVIALLLLVLVPAVSACNRIEADENSSIAAKADTRISDELAAPAQLAAESSSEIIMPAQYQFSRTGATLKAKNWNELLYQLPASDRAYLEKINTNYFGALEFKDVDELRKMALLGIPLPEEWLEARKMTDTELKNLADAGNAKAAMFYADRLIDQAIEYLPLRKTDPRAYDAGPGAQAGVRAYVAVGQLASDTTSPFAAYLSGRMQYALPTTRSPESIAGALFAAAGRGDRRAPRLLGEFVKSHPDMDVGLIMSTYQSLQANPRIP